MAFKDQKRVQIVQVSSAIDRGAHGNYGAMLVTSGVHGGHKGLLLEVCTPLSLLARISQIPPCQKKSEVF